MRYNKRLLILVFCLCISGLVSSVYASNEVVRVLEGSQIEIFPNSTEHLNFSYTDIFGDNYKMNIEKVIISPTYILIVTEEGELQIDLSTIQYINLQVCDKAEDDVYEPLRVESIFQQKLKYKEPEIINSWITIKGQTVGRMIKELLVIDNYLIIQVEPSILHIYPYINVDNWSYQIVDGRPNDIFRDFVHDVNSNDINKLSRWIRDKEIVAKIPSDTNIIPVHEIPVASNQYICNLVIGWDKDSRQYIEYVIVLQYTNDKWFLLDWIK